MLTSVSPAVPVRCETHGLNWRSTIITGKTAVRTGQPCCCKQVWPHCSVPFDRWALMFPSWCFLHSWCHYLALSQSRRTVLLVQMSQSSAARSHLWTARFDGDFNHSLRLSCAALLVEISTWSLRRFRAQLQCFCTNCEKTPCLMTSCYDCFDSGRNWLVVTVLTS